MKTSNAAFVLSAFVLMAILTSVAEGRKIKQRLHLFGQRPRNLQRSRTISYHEAYTQWSSWSRCDRKCRQTRTRDCLPRSFCDGNSVTEERSCSPRKCRPRRVVIPVRQQATTEENKHLPLEVRVLHDLHDFVYSAWSEWSPCTERCSTTRFRKCEMPQACGRSSLQEDAICYDEGTPCEVEWKRKMEDRYRNVGNETVEREALAELDGQTCGKSTVKDIMLRIIGGRQAIPGSWPWQAGIMTKHKNVYCGGTLISPLWVITAAHCVRRKMFVRLGEHNLENDDGTEQDLKVDEYYIHDEFDPVTIDNDIALLRLEKPAIINDYVRPVCLPDADDHLSVGTRGTILGWGKRRDVSTEGTEVLHQAEVPIVNRQDCREALVDYLITENMICAGYKRGRVDSCSGDSGGSLLYKHDGSWFVYGITSFGDGCGTEGKYGIYATVPNFIYWIRWTIARYS